MSSQRDRYDDWETEDARRAAARERLAARQYSAQSHEQPSSQQPYDSNADARQATYRRSRYTQAPQTYATAGTYSRTSYRHRRRRSKVPYIVAAAVALVVVVGAGFGVFALMGALGSGSSANSTSSTTSTDATDTALPAANDAAQPATADSVVMTLGGSQETYVLKGEEYLEAGCHAVDSSVPENITDSVQISGEVDTQTAGDYTITYTATTASGAQATKERIVHVVDSFEEAATSLPVLMYHYVYTASDQPEELNGNYILDTQLAAQLQYLSENDYYYPSYQEIKAFAEGTHTLPAKSVVLTFDDGEAGFLKYGIPLLAQYQVPATSFVICSDADATEKILNNANEYVQFQSHSYAMHQAGSNVGRGGRIHAMTKEEIMDDVRQSQEILGTTEALAYPFGDNNDTAHEALRELGVLCAFTIVNDRVYPGDDTMALNRVRISSEYSQESFEYLVAPNAV